MANKEELLKEAYGRGILPPAKARAYEELMRRRNEADAANKVDAPEPDFFDRMGDRFRERSRQQMETLAYAPEQTLPETAIQTAGNVAGLALDTASELTTSAGKALSAIVPDEIEEPFMDAVKAAGSAVLSTELAQEAMSALKQGTEAYMQWSEANPRAARTVNAIFNTTLASRATGVKPKPDGSSAFGDVVGKAQDVVAAVPETAERGTKKIASLLLPKTDRQVIDAATEQGLPMTVGTVFGGNVVPKVEEVLSKAPISGAGIRGKAQAISTKSEEIIASLSDAIHAGPRISAQEAGAELGEGVNTAIRETRQAVGENFEKFMPMLPKDKPIKLEKAKAALAALRDEYADDPDIERLLNTGPFVQIANESLAGQKAKNLRQRISDKADLAAKNYGGNLARRINEVNKLLDEDIGRAVAEFVPDGDKLLKEANKKARLGYAVIDDLQSFLGKSSDEQLITKFLKLSQQPTKLSARGADAKLLQTLNKKLPQEAMDRLASYQLQLMGLETAGREGLEISFNPRTFVTEWKKLSPKAKQILFEERLNDDQMKVLRGAAKYFDSVSAVPLNPSGTASVNVEGVSLGLGAILAGQGGLTPWVALLPLATGTALSSQRLAKAINKLPRELMTKPVTRETKDAITSAALAAGVSEADVQTIDQLLEENIEDGQ